MIRAAVIHARPIFLLGLTQILAHGRVRVVGAWTSPPDEQSWRADVVLVDSEALQPEHGLRYITALARRSAVMVLTSGRHRHLKAAFRDAGAAVTVDEAAPVHVLLSEVRNAVAEARPVVGQAANGPTEPLAQGLSKREGQVLMQISLGLTHQQIAHRLGISQHTVDTYVKRIRMKLGVGNKAELTRAALDGSARL